MQVRLSTSADFYSAFPTPHSLYSSAVFIRLNACRAEAVRHFIGYDEKDCPRLGIVMGYRQRQWLSPFSAPFGEIHYNKPQSIETIYDFITELADLTGDDDVKITLPPTFYDEDMLPRFTGVLANFASKAYYDYNYHYDLAEFPKYVDAIDRSARKNLKKAMSEDMIFEQTCDIERAYAIIQANRQSHCYPLALSLQQVKDTVSPAGPALADFFVLSHAGIDIAAAMVYHVRPGIVQVIYWGDAPGHTHLRPMNLLAYNVFKHYYESGEKIVDVGPSSSQGIPSSGLCRFKENIGCILTLKPTFTF